MPRYLDTDSLDFSWLDTLDVAPEQKQKIVDMAREEFRRNAQELANQTAELEHRLHDSMTRLNQWERVRAENPVIFQDFARTSQVLRQFRSPDELVSRLSANETGTATLHHQQAQAEGDMARVLALAQAGDISWEQAQTAMRDIASHLQRVGGDVSQLKRIYTEQVPKLENRLAELHSITQQQIGSMVPFTAEMIQYHSRYPDRDLNRIVQHAAQHRLSFQQAAASLYGQEDYEREISARVEAKLAEERKTRERHQGNLAPGSPEVTAEGHASAPSKVFHIRRNADHASTQTRPPRTPGEFQQRIAIDIAKVANQL